MDERPEISDVELISRCRAGDGSAFAQLLVTYRPVVRRAGYRFGLRATDIDDIEQLVWMALWHHPPDLQRPDGLRSWLWVVTTNECRRFVRQRSRTVSAEMLPDPPCPDEQTPERCASRVDDGRTVERLLATIRPDEKVLIRLLVGDDRPDYQRIGATVQRPVGSLGPTRARILKKLRRAATSAGLVA